jgi:hypothetical protein
MTPDELEARIARLEAIHEIQNLQGRYNHFLLMSKNDGIVDLFAKKDADVKAEIADSGVYLGIEGVKRLFVKGMHAKHAIRGGLGLHMVSTPVIEVSRDGKTARGMWFTFGANTRRDETGLHALWMAGKYDNEFVKEDGKWRFRSIHWHVFFRSPFEEGWVRRPIVGSGTQAEGEPDRPSSYYMPYHPDGFNTFLPPPPEPEK